MKILQLVFKLIICQINRHYHFKENLKYYGERERKRERGGTYCLHQEQCLFWMQPFSILVCKSHAGPKFTLRNQTKEVHRLFLQVNSNFQHA